MDCRNLSKPPNQHDSNIFKDTAPSVPSEPSTFLLTRAPAARGVNPNSQVIFESNDFNAKEWSSWTDCGTPNDQSTRGGLKFLIHLRSTFRSLTAVGCVGGAEVHGQFPRKIQDKVQPATVCVWTVEDVCKPFPNRQAMHWRHEGDTAMQCVPQSVRTRESFVTCWNNLEN